MIDLPLLDAEDLKAFLRTARKEIPEDSHAEVLEVLNEALTSYVVCRLAASTVTHSQLRKRLQQMYGSRGDPRTKTANAIGAAAWREVRRAAGQQDVSIDNADEAKVRELAKIAEANVIIRQRRERSRRPRHEGDPYLGRIFHAVNSVFVAYFDELPGVTMPGPRGPYIEFCFRVLETYSTKISPALEAAVRGKSLSQSIFPSNRPEEFIHRQFRKSGGSNWKRLADQILKRSIPDAPEDGRTERSRLLAAWTRPTPP